MKTKEGCSAFEGGEISLSLTAGNKNGGGGTCRRKKDCAYLGGNTGS